MEGSDQPPGVNKVKYYHRLGCLLLLENCLFADFVVMNEGLRPSLFPSPSFASISTSNAYACVHSPNANHEVGYFSKNFIF